MSSLFRLICFGCLTALFALPQDMFAEERDSVIQAESPSSEKKDNVLKVDLQLLSHGETRNGGMPQEATVEQTNFVLGRERLVIDFERPGLETMMNIQHSGIWGQSGKGSFNVFEAWAKMSARNGMFAQIGRIALAYDDERIIGPNDWAMASMSHDALRLGYEGHGHKAHLVLSYNQNAENVTTGGSFYENGAQPYKSMLTAWYHYDVPKLPLGASVLFMNIGMQGGEKEEDPHTEYQQLLGGYVSFHPKHWKLEGSYYHQFGRSEEGIKVDAWMASGKVVWDPTDKYGFDLGYDYLSGDDKFAVPAQGSIGMTHHEIIKGFNPIYGSHHQFYGAMDFFYVSTYLFGFTPGLQNAYLGGHYQPFKGFSLQANYHYLAIATNLIDMKKTLGHEWEIQAKYDFSKDIHLSGGFSFMTGTETMERLKRASANGRLRWGWISLSITPRIFTTKW